MQCFNSNILNILSNLDNKEVQNRSYEFDMLASDGRLCNFSKERYFWIRRVNTIDFQISKNTCK